MSLKSIFSIFKASAEKVAPEIQAEIDRVMAAARAKADDLKAKHSVQAIVDEADASIKAVKDTAAHHILLIEAERDRLVAAANAVLPPIKLSPVPEGVQSA